MLNSDENSVMLDLHRLAGVVVHCVKLNSVLRTSVYRSVRYHRLMCSKEKQGNQGGIHGLHPNIGRETPVGRG